MSKKNIKIKKIKKAIKLLKSKPTSEKLKKEKPAKAKPEKKAAQKVQVKNIVKKKQNTKKISKPAKKIVANKPSSVKTKPTSIKKKEIITKPVKKVISKKENTKSIDLASKKEKNTKTAATSVIAKKEDKAKKSDAILTKRPESVNVGFLKQKPSRSRSKRGRKKKNKGDDDEPEILHDELVEQLIRSTKKLRSQPKVPKMLKTFVNPMASLTVAAQPNESKKSAAVAKKEPKGKFSVEYVIRTSGGILYEFLTTPSGLSEWFADDVNIHDGIFTFFWDGSAQKARLLGFKEEEYVRMQWMDKPEGTYFEFRIQKDDITGDVSLIVTDFADEASDLETSKRLWDTQVDKLLHIIGSY